MKYKKPGKELNFKLVHEDTIFRTKEAKIIKKQIEAIGIRVLLVSQKQLKYLQTLKEINYSGMILTSFRNLRILTIILSSHHLLRKQRLYWE